MPDFEGFSRGEVREPGRVFGLEGDFAIFWFLGFARMFGVLWCRIYGFRGSPGSVGSRVGVWGVFGRIVGDISLFPLYVGLRDVLDWYFGLPDFSGMCRELEPGEVLEGW